MTDEMKEYVQKVAKEIENISKNSTKYSFTNEGLMVLFSNKVKSKIHDVVVKK